MSSQAKVIAKAKSAAAGPGSGSGPGLGGFSLLNLKVGRFVRVEAHPNSDKMFVSQVQLAGDSVKQICSGLRQHIAPEFLEGKLCVVVDNMKKCKLRGEISEAMVLCGEHAEPSGGETKVELVSPEKESLELVGRQVVIDAEAEDATDRKIKPREWEAVSSCLQVDGSRGVVYMDEGKAKPLFVKVGDEKVRVTVATLPEGSNVR